MSFYIHISPSRQLRSQAQKLLVKSAAEGGSDTIDFGTSLPRQAVIKLRTVRIWQRIKETSAYSYSSEILSVVNVSQVTNGEESKGAAQAREKTND